MLFSNKHGLTHFWKSARSAFFLLELLLLEHNRVNNTQAQRSVRLFSMTETYLQQVLTVFQADLTQDALHCLPRFADLFDISNWDLIHDSSQALIKENKFSTGYKAFTLFYKIIIKICFYFIYSANIHHISQPTKLPLFFNCSIIKLEKYFL